MAESRCLGFKSICAFGLFQCPDFVKFSRALQIQFLFNQVRDDSENPDAAEAIDSEDGGGGGEGTVDTRKGETLRGTEAHPRATTGTRSRRAAANLPTNDEGKDQTNEGQSSAILKAKSHEKWKVQVF